MKKILLIDDSDTYTWCLQKYLQHRGYPVKTACTLKEARAAIQEEMPLVVCCDLDLPDGSGMDFLDEVRAADKELPFILASCHDKDDYEQEAMRRGAMLCMDKMKGLLLQDKLVEYAYRQLSGEKAPTFHKLLFVHAEDTSAEVLRAAMLQKGFDLILVPSIGEAKRRIFEDKEIELILCDLELPDGTAMELFHTLRRVAGMFQMKNPPVRLLPFFILTENNDLATEYEYRPQGRPPRTPVLQALILCTFEMPSPGAASFSSPPGRFRRVAGGGTEAAPCQTPLPRLPGRKALLNRATWGIIFP